MKVLHIIGADLSKKTIDFATHQGTHCQTGNNLGGFHQLLQWIEKQSIDVSQMMIVMEHTGLYSYLLEQFLHQQQLRFTKVSALAIKRSMGLVRGKNDKIDAIRIARYGFEKQDQLDSSQPVNKILERLQMLHSTRDRLVKNRSALLRAVKEYQHTCGLSNNDLIIKS